MMVHVETKPRRQPVGRVADYCLICHARRPFRLVRVSLTVHVFLVPVSEAELLGHERDCEGCGQRYPAWPRAYRKVSRERGLDLDALIRLTNPGLTAGLAAEAALNEELQDRPVGPDDRAGLLAGPFHAVRADLRERARTVHVDLWSGAAIAAAAVVPLTLILALGIGDPSRVPASVTAVVLLAVSLVLLGTDVRRFVRRTVRPRLVRGLAPYDPTLEELEALAAADPVVGKVARRVRLEALRRALAEIGRSVV